MNNKLIGVIFVLLIIIAVGGMYAYRAAAPTTVVPTGKEDLIRVFSPLPNAVVKSPLVVEGQARGNWFFEGSFPLKLLDANGNEIARGIAQSQGEWMTTEFVSFKATLNFDAPTTKIGTLVLSKDNPSDKREFDDELRVSIHFR